MKPLPCPFCAKEPVDLGSYTKCKHCDYELPERIWNMRRLTKITGNSHSAETKQACLDAVAAGESAYSVANRFGLARRTIYDWWIEDGNEPLSVRQNRQRAERDATIKRMYLSDGISRPEIAKRLDIPYSAVKSVLERLSPTGKIRDLRGGG